MRPVTSPSRERRAANVNPLATKLAARIHLSEEDRAAIDRAIGRNVREFAARRDMVREGERPRAVCVMLEGWAYCYKTLRDGRRQIVGLLVPGDVSELNIFMVKEMDHSVGAITGVVAAELGRDELERLTEEHPHVTQALWWNELVTVSTQREWTLNVGQRTAYERIAHLMCEMFLRLGIVGLTQEGSCDFPITQADIGDATGLTPVHVNRMLKELRGDGLIDLRGRRLTILDFSGLRRAAMFNDNYLHLGRERRHSGANG
jgi:CRP-like cAMP-binding protein